MHFSAGMMVSTNVRLTRPLGEGAMGCVWIADHLTLKTEVAVKFISATLAMSDPEVLERFVREASLAAQIKSPHVVQTFDQGVMADGTPYIVMELLQGESLQELIERVETIDVAQATNVIVQVARALSKAHELNIIHRDIKPDNIFITHTEDGMFAKILDFGIAKQTTQLPKMGSLTSPGVMVGTPEYMSPEQVLSARDVDYQADLWALGVTAYYCLTGDLPFTAEALGTLCVKLLDGEFAPASSINPALHAGFDGFFAKALANSPDDRFQSARELATAMVAIAKQSHASIADELSYGAMTPSQGVMSSPILVTQPLPAGSHETVPLPSISTAPLPENIGAMTARSAVPFETKSQTLTGSSSNRLQPPMNRRSGWVVGAFVGVVALAIAIGGGIAMMNEQPTTTEQNGAAALPPPMETSVAVAPSPPSATVQAPTPSASVSASQEPSATPAPSVKVAPTPGPVRTYPQPATKPNRLPGFPDDL